MTRRSRHGDHVSFALWSQAIRAPYLIEANQANFVACHQYPSSNAWICSNTPKKAASSCSTVCSAPKKIWDHLEQEVQKDIITKKLKFHVINGYDVAEKTGMGGRMNTIMQTAFFAISGILPRDAAIAEIKHAIEKTYGKRGEAVVKKNFEAVDANCGESL
jgi:pyruvate-ferredoxin/flavodoxin oxidoreductase